MKHKFGLLPKVLLAIALGIVFGLFVPEWFTRIALTFNNIFGNFLNFVIPLLILGLVAPGIADLGSKAGRLLVITAALAYAFTLFSGFGTFFTSFGILPRLLGGTEMSAPGETAATPMQPFFTVEMPPLMGVMTALILAFVLGLGMAYIHSDKLKGMMDDFKLIIERVISKVIIPLLPLYVCGTFIDMTKSGKTYAILGILWKVFLVVIIMHLVCIFLQFCVAGAVSHKSPFKMIRNQIPGYTTALGTQSSAATIPVNLQCAAADGVSEQIRNFVVPLCANIHMAGSMITITACATAVCLMNQLPISLATVVPFIMTLGVAMVASPGAPGGSIMTALPFLYMIFGAEAGDPNGPICAIMVALYITQDSFGTACNVSGDNAIGVIVETIYQKFINKSSASV